GLRWISTFPSEGDRVLCYGSFLSRGSEGIATYDQARWNKKLVWFRQKYQNSNSCFDFDLAKRSLAPQ
ncbi:MAG: hypothetical protein ACKN9U_18770, partial [Pirellulaceae bacterium]